MKDQTPGFGLLPCLLLDLVAIVGLALSLWWGTSVESLVANLVLVMVLLCGTIAVVVQSRRTSRENEDLSSDKGA